MDLTYEELEALIDKIAVGKSFLLIDDSFITLIYPDNAIKIKAKHIINDKEVRFCYATKEKFYVLGNYLYELGNKNGIKKPAA